MTDQLAELRVALEGRYRVERELGAGGMATVYLAVDLRHERRVAVKVLRPDLAAVLGADRFLQEIRITAGLQHPHILPLFDSGAVGHILFYVMPYVEGESLRQRLRRERQLPVEDSCRIASEVASALDYAHRHGLIHRDIKPENVLMHDGRALVADFGIALAIQTAGGARLTESGLALGTPEYMSPEQATGDRLLDPRSDIYSLGCLVYEMLAGEPPHQGPTAQAIIARVMTETPRPLSVSRPTVPPSVAAAVHRALQRSPADRFATAAEFAAALTGAVSTESNATTVAGREQRVDSSTRRNRITLGTVAVALLAAGVLIGRLIWNQARPAQLRMELYLGADSTSQIDDHLPYPLRISRDGQRVVYVGRTSKGTVLFLRSLSDRQARPIPGTEGGSSPAFSPDGDSVAFLAESAIRKVSLTGGRPVTLVSDVGPAEVFNGFDWGLDGTVIYTVGRPARLFLVSSAGGAAPKPLGLGPCSYGSPRYLASPRAVLTECNIGGKSDLAVVPLSGGAPRKLGINGTGPRYAAGRVLYMRRDGTLFAQRTDERTRIIIGSPSAISSDIENPAEQGSGEYDVSESGTLVYVARRTGSQLVVVDSHGSKRLILAGDVEWPRFSPEGDRIAYVKDVDSGSELWVTSLKQHTSQRLVYEGHPGYPTWYPNGHRIAYSGNKGGDVDLWSVPADGGGEATQLLQRSLGQFMSAFSSDGRWLVFTDAATQVDGDVVAMSTAPGAKPEVLFTSPFVESEPAVSPNGRWLAYSSNETGTFEVYVRPFRREGGRQLISVSGGDGPVWSRSGQEIFYRHGLELMIATVVPGDPFRVANRRVLFDRPDDVIVTANRYYDVSPDGSQFVFVTRPGERRIVVILGALSGK